VTGLERRDPAAIAVARILGICLGDQRLEQRRLAD
jgi:GMP synthase-like glutamine amidotransferase